MTLAVVADDAAGNRAAAFRDLNHGSRGPARGHRCFDGRIGRLQHLGPHGCYRRRIGGWTDCSAVFKLTYSDGVIALADGTDATVHLVDWETVKWPTNGRTLQ